MGAVIKTNEVIDTVFTHTGFRRLFYLPNNNSGH